MLWEWQTLYSKRLGKGCVGTMGADYRHMWEVITTGIEDKTVRVKYLDKEDIEELGWIYMGEIFNNSYSEFYHPNEGKDNRTLRFSHNLDFMEIEIGIRYGDFYGESYKIKNYNELKTLMKQLGI